MNSAGSAVNNEAIAYDFTAGEDAAVNAWTTGTIFSVFRFGSDTGTAQAAVGMSSPFATRFMTFGIAASTLAVELHLNRPKEADASSEITWTGQGDPLAINTWYVAFAIHDGAALKIYVDGVDQGATYAEIEDVNDTLDESTWLADFGQTIGNFSMGGKMESDGGNVLRGMDGQTLGAGLMETPLDAASVTLASNFLRATLIGA
jgi:hypothetical protein